MYVNGKERNRGEPRWGKREREREPQLDSGSASRDRHRVAREHEQDDHTNGTLAYLTVAGLRSPSSTRPQASLAADALCTVSSTSKVQSTANTSRERGIIITRERGTKRGREGSQKRT
jgi:hypothetical protein